MSASLGDHSAWIRGQSKSPQVPDLNLIPDELRRKGGLSRDRQLGLLILLELLIIVTIYPSYGPGSVSAIRGGEETSVAPPSGEDGLSRSIAQARSTLSSFKAISAEINTRRIRWPELLDLIYNRVSSGVTVLTFEQSEQEVTLRGLATVHQEVFTYLDALVESPFISQAVAPDVGRDPGSEKVSFTFVLTLEKGVTLETE